MHSEQNPNTLILEISRQGNALSMSSFERKDFASTVRSYSRQQVCFREIDRLSDEANLILNKAVKKNSDQAQLSRELEKIGQLLCGHLLTKQARDKLKNCSASSLALSIDEKLIGIPWELLHNGENFFCLAFNLGRVVRTKNPSYTLRYRGFSGLPRMLILANPTNDLRCAYLEGLNIKNQFYRKRNSVRIDFKSSHIDKLYVMKNICDYDIVHFAGHCEYQESRPKDSGWVLSDGRFTINDIFSAGQNTLPALVFSNACHSSFTNSKLAEAFLVSGVRHFIGTTSKIKDTVSLEFAKEFYSRLTSGRSVGESMRLGRLRLIKKYGVSGLAWTSYLLYGDPDFILFRHKTAILAERRGFSLKKGINWLYFLLGSVCMCIYLLYR